MSAMICLFIPDTIYTERYMLEPSQNPEFYAVGVSLANKLSSLLPDGHDD